jgi:hypothetical protein
MKNCEYQDGIETKALPWQTIMVAPSLKLTMQKFFCFFALLWHCGDDGSVVVGIVNGDDVIVVMMALWLSLPLSSSMVLMVLILLL